MGKTALGDKKRAAQGGEDDWERGDGGRGNRGTALSKPSGDGGVMQSRDDPLVLSYVLIGARCRV